MDPKQAKVFIGGISSETTEERLKDYFKTFGDVVEAVIVKDRLTARSRGFGFLVFADPAVADSLLLDSKHSIDGHMVEVKKAVSRDKQHSITQSNGGQSQIRTKKIFVGGLAPNVTENDMRKYFEQFGTITDAFVIYDHTTQTSRGFGFVTFDSEDVVDIVVQNPFYEFNGKMVQVKRAIPKELSSGHIGFPEGKGGNFGASYGNFGVFNSTPTLVGGYGPPMNTSYGAAPGWTSIYSVYGPTGCIAPSYGSGAAYGPATTGGGYANATFVNNIPTHGSSYGEASITYEIPVAYGAGNGGLYGNDAAYTPISNVWGAPAPMAYGNTCCSRGYGSRSSGGISQYGVAQVDNGQSNGSSGGHAAQNSGYGTEVTPYS